MNSLLEFVSFLVKAMRRVHVVPKGMVDAIYAHLDHDEVIPFLLRQKMTRHLETLPRHLVNIGQDFLFVSRAEIAHVQNIFAHQALDLAFQFSRLGVFAVCISREEIRYKQSVERPRWVSARHTHDDGALSVSRKDVP